MVTLASIAQAIAIMTACWAVISAVGAWKREFIGKRQIELAEQVLAKFFEVRDAIAFIRNPFSSAEEGKSRARAIGETEEAAQLLDRGYVVFERYEKKRQVFTDFQVLKYRCMANFGSEVESVFMATSKVLNSILVSANMLATHYWPRQGRVRMEPDEFKKHLEEMDRHEGIFWDTDAEDDEIKGKLRDIQTSLERITAPCFREPMGLYTVLTKPRGKNG